MFPVIKNREKKRYAKILEKSIEQKEFRFMYQPIVNTNGNGIGLEMLVRWQHKGNWVSPLVFIPIIEEYQLISAFNKLLVDQLVIDWHTLKEKLQNISFISINVSPYIFVYNEETAFMEYLMEQLKANGISPAEIYLEITETSMLTESAFGFLGECRQKGS